MINTDQDALICDLAETYHIYNYRELPVSQVALLSVGLRENSRIKLKLAGLNCSSDQLMMATIIDRLNLLIWSQTKDGQNNRNRPESLVNKLMSEKSESDVVSFASGEEFLAYRRKLIGEE